MNNHHEEPAYARVSHKKSRNNSHRIRNSIKTWMNTSHCQYDVTGLHEAMFVFVRLQLGSIILDRKMVPRICRLENRMK